MKPITHALLIVCLGLLVYANSLNVPFAFDDYINIVENPAVKDFSFFLDTSKLEGFKIYQDGGILSFSYPFKRRVVGYFTFALNYRLHGLDVFGYHVVNISIHIINALLVYWLILLTFRTPFMRARREPMSDEPIAIFIAFFFVAHPIQTQSVTYIVQRFVSLATLFYLFSLVCYIKSRITVVSGQQSAISSQEAKYIKFKKWGYYCGSVISAILAMKTKEIAFTLPIVITLYEFLFFEGDKKWKRIVYLLPLLLTIFIIPLMMLEGSPLFNSDPRGVSLTENLRLTPNISRWDYFLTQFRVIVTYIRLMFPPVIQNLDYDYQVFHSFFEPEVFLSFLMLFSVFSLGIYLAYHSRRAGEYGRENRLIGFGIMWFFITLSVESSVIPITDVIFEHRVYLPSVGFITAVVVCAEMVRKRLLQKGMIWGRSVVPIAVAMLLILSGATYARNTVWQDKLTLWMDVVKKSPNNARAHNNLGQILADRRRTGEAMSEFQTAIRLNPNYSTAYSNLGAMYRRIGNMDEALENYRTAIKLDKFNMDAYNNLGVALREVGRLDEAEQQLKSAILLKPNYSLLHYNMGLLYDRMGRIDEALREFRIAEELSPQDTRMRFKREVVEARIITLKNALEKSSDKTQIHYNLGVIYDSLGEMKKAEDEYRAAIREDHINADAHSNLGVIYAKQGNFEKALEEFKIALELRPDDKGIKVNLETASRGLKQKLRPR